MRYLNAIIPTLRSTIIKPKIEKKYSTTGYLNMRMYTKSHEYIDKEEGKSIAKVGISKYASQNVGPILYTETVDEDNIVEKGSVISILETVKSANDVYSPISGIILEKNNKVIEEPYIITNDPLGDGWILKISCNKIDDKELMTDEEYEKYVDKIRGY
jgi:glycine cleavage system H protein